MMWSSFFDLNNSGIASRNAALSGESTNSENMPPYVAPARHIPRSRFIEGTLPKHATVRASLLVLVLTSWSLPNTEKRLTKKDTHRGARGIAQREREVGGRSMAGPCR